MKPSTSFTPAANVAILVVGEPGTGKSCLSLAFPNPGILDCDGNLGSAVRRSSGKKFLYSQPFVDDDGKEVLDIDRWRRAKSECAKMLASSDTKTLVIDGLSNLARWALIHCENELIKSGINIKKEYLAKYMLVIPELTNFFTTIRLPGKIVVVTVHQTVDKDELSGRMLYKLDIPGRLADTLGGQFTDVWGMSATPDPTNVKTQARYDIRSKPTGYHVNLKTSLDLEPAINITDKTPNDVWRLLEPKLSTNLPTHVPNKV